MTPRLFSELGRREEALAAGQEATEIYRRLAAQRPDAFLADFSGFLNFAFDSRDLFTTWLVASVTTARRERSAAEELLGERAPALAVVLGVIGLGLIGWVKRRFA